MPRKLKDRPLCSGTKTLAEVMSWVRSLLRRASIRWKPISDVLKASRRPYVGPNKRLKWEYQCAICMAYFPRKSVEIDHTREGFNSLRDWDDIGEFCKGLFCEVQDLRVLCKPCHKGCTNNQRG